MSRVRRRECGEKERSLTGQCTSRGQHWETVSPYCWVSDSSATLSAESVLILRNLIVIASLEGIASEQPSTRSLKPGEGG